MSVVREGHVLGEPRGLRLSRLAARTKLALVIVLLDVLLVSGGYLLLVVLRFDAAIPDQYWGSFGSFLWVAALAHVVVNALFGLYSEMWRHASIAEARRVALAGVTTALVLTLYTIPNRGQTPLSVPLIGGVLATVSIGTLRFQSRLFALRRRSRSDDIRRIAVIGAGEAAAHILREMRRTPDGYKAAIVLDDDPRKWGMTLLGCTVTGPIERLADIDVRGDVDSALLAIPSATGALVRRVQAIAEDTELPLQILPKASDLWGSAPTIRDVRDLEIDDLLGRAEIASDLASVVSLIEGKTVLVTGGGGSIGSEIARQVSMFRPATLVLLDSDETHLHDARAKVDPSVECHSALVNIRDLGRVREIFGTYRPDVVLHAAALKHVPVLETNAREAVATNVLGMQAVVDAAIEFDVERFVFISTDKAVNPSSVMGATKWLGEQMLLTRAPRTGSWCCVRFGNVLGSRGSVLPTFERQIRKGGPVTVTDDRMTRYFMSVQEAVQLVLQAASIAHERGIFMLDMGEPVAISDLARKMIRLTGKQPGRDIDIVFTGMRPGEKLEEELHMPTELLRPTVHPSIHQLEPLIVEPKIIDSVIDTLGDMVRTDADAAIRDLVMTFVSERSTDFRGIDLSSWDNEPIDLVTQTPVVVPPGRPDDN